MGSPIETSLFINNEFVPSSTGETFDLFSPYSRDLQARVAEASSDDVDKAVNAAEAAFPAWSALSPLQRGVPMKKLAEKILAGTPELAELEAISMGTPVSDYAFECHYAAVHFNYFGEAAYTQGHTSLNSPGFLNLSLRQPFGVVGIIIPWNSPLVFFSKKIAPAIAAGNTVVLKSSEKAPLTSWKVSQWIEECGFPPGVINIVSGHGQIGAAIASHMRIRALSFTGSSRTGRAIQIASAKSNLKKVVFELGGKGPSLIFEDADLEEAVKATSFSIFWKSGQTCMANSRIYVQESIKEKFLEVFKEVATNRIIGDPKDPKTNHGPQADKVQFDIVHKYIESGKESGGKLLTGGGKIMTDSKSLAIPPVIFTDQPEDSKIMKEEIFGPVVVVNTFKTEEEALAKANDTEFGLYASLFTKDLERALRVSKKLESGMVGVNVASPTGSWDLPFGGWKSSGTGRESLMESMDHFTEQKSIYIKVPGI